MNDIFATEDGVVARCAMVSSMAKSVDLVYDRLLAGDKIKSSDKYEVLAAVVFSILEDRATVHDMRLLGASGVRHQIDAVVRAGSKERRVLIECKDYDRKIGLPLVRNFFGAVEDLKPDQAFMVTTVGYTKPACVYAEAEGIRLAVLRPPEGNDDWGNLVQRINFNMVVHVPAADPTVDWNVVPEDAEAVAASPKQGSAHVDDVQLAYPDGRTETARELLNQHVNVPPAGEIGYASGEVTFDEPVLVRFEGWPDLRITGFTWSRPWTTAQHSFSIGDGIGGLAAELVLRTLDGEIHRMFTNRQLVTWILDESGRVVPRTSL